MTTTFHRHWRDVPEGTWRWPNFSPAEIACWGTGKLLVNEPALDKLQALRDRLGKPLIVRSAYRSPEHNRAVGGATQGGAQTECRGQGERQIDHFDALITGAGLHAGTPGQKGCLARQS